MCGTCPGSGGDGGGGQSNNRFSFIGTPGPPFLSRQGAVYLIHITVFVASTIAVGMIASSLAGSS